MFVRRFRTSPERTSTTMSAHRRLAAFACLTVTTSIVPSAVTAQDPPPGPLPPALRAAWDSAWTAWDDGDFAGALSTLDRLLRAPGAEALLRPAALLTGEAWRTTELTADGRAPRWSPDGRFIAFETGAPAAARTRVLAADGRAVVELAGSGAAFSADGSAVAWIRPATGGAPRVLTRHLATGRERALRTGGLMVRGLAWAGATVYAAAADSTAQVNRIVRLAPDAEPEVAFRVPAGSPFTGLQALSGGRLLAVLGAPRFAVIDPGAARTFTLEGTSPSASGDGQWIGYVGSDGAASTLQLVSTASGTPVTVRRSERPLASPALSRDGRRIAFQMMPREDWELYVIDGDGTHESRITRDIQHDVLPRFLQDGLLLAAMGEPRHRRSYLYHLATAAQPAGAGADVAAALLPGTPGRSRLFHNNTVRTVAPEYEWHPSPDGSKLLIVAERDGDTVSPERGIYLTDLGQPVTRDDVLARIGAGLDAEKRLRESGARAFAPIRAEVVQVVAGVSTSRIYRYANDLIQFDSKYITEPGNAKAIEYIAAKLREFGYEPELQWFTPPARRGRGAEPPAGGPPAGRQPEVRTANIIARLPGTANPERVYVVSSHFDSNARSPGADDDSSGSTALLEAARVMAGHPQAATIEFAFFTGEEAGLLGSREYVRRAVESGKPIAGALNNDMVGFANDQRLDNTIRYSSDGIRDIQHAAAMLFTNLITYDAKYYKSTDAQAYYDAYGDIVGGIGSYPILASPHYHQTHDVLETINQRLVAEVSKTTVATLMLLASSPARLTGLWLTRSGAALEAAWEPAPERGVSGYLVAWGPTDDPLRETVRTTEPRHTWRQALPAGTVISVKAVGARGLESWDWARTLVPAGGAR
jgi:hypothetical protein